MNRFDFLHNHHELEKKLGLDSEHVIVDRIDWEAIKVPHGKVLTIPFPEGNDKREFCLKAIKTIQTQMDSLDDVKQYPIMPKDSVRTSTGAIITDEPHPTREGKRSITVGLPTLDASGKPIQPGEKPKISGKPKTAYALAIQTTTAYFKKHREENKDAKVADILIQVDGNNFVFPEFEEFHSILKDNCKENA